MIASLFLGTKAFRGSEVGHSQPWQYLTEESGEVAVGESDDPPDAGGLIR